MRARPVRGLPLFLAAMLLVLACENSVSTSLDNAACDAAYRCADGYVCDVASRTCVRPGMQSASCADGETSCAGALRQALIRTDESSACWPLLTPS